MGAVMDEMLGEPGYPLPLVERLDGGGIAISSDVARAVADAKGPLSFSLEHEGLTTILLGYAPFRQEGNGLRWVGGRYPDALYANEEFYHFRLGTRSSTWRHTAAGWVADRPNTMLTSVVKWRGKLLALGRMIRFVKDGANQHGEMGDARFVTIDKIEPPKLPAKFCPAQLETSEDGTLLITGSRCLAPNAIDVTKPAVVRVLPGTNQGVMEDLPASGLVHGSVGGAHDIYAAAGNTVFHHNGTAWQPMPIPSDDVIIVESLSVSPTHQVFAVVQSAVPARITRKLLTHGEGAWTELAMPLAPSEPRRDNYDPYAVHADYLGIRATEPLEPDAALEKNEELDVFGGGHLDVHPLSVDARGDEILVLAAGAGEILLLSTRARTPVVTLPSQDGARMTIGRSMKRPVAKSVSQCPGKRAFLALPEHVSADAVASISAEVGRSVYRSTVTSRPRLVLIGEESTLNAATKVLAELRPTLYCGAPVFEDP